jgi:hypothetical protein
MSDPFEHRLGDLFGQQADLQDAHAFTSSVERALERRFRRTVVLILAAGLALFAVTAPLLGPGLVVLSAGMAGVFSQAGQSVSATPITALAVMTVIGVLAAIFGGYQASRT